MGWTYTHKPHGMKVRAFMRDRFEQAYVPGEKDGFRVLHDTATLREYFAIVERTPHDTGIPVLFCLVCLTHHVREAYNFGFKDMTEACGPNAIPPASFFALLERMIPEPDGVHGAAWRERCRAAYARRAAALSCGAGDTVTFQDVAYMILEKLPRRGVRVRHMGTGEIYLMTTAQLRRAQTCAPDTAENAA
jgi:hypothetical protein